MWTDNNQGTHTQAADCTGKTPSARNMRRQAGHPGNASCPKQAIQQQKTKPKCGAAYCSTCQTATSLTTLLLWLTALVPEHIYWGTSSNARSPFYLEFLAVSISRRHLGGQHIQEMRAAFLKSPLQWSQRETCRLQNAYLWHLSKFFLMYFGFWAFPILNEGSVNNMANISLAIAQSCAQNCSGCCSN